MATPPLFEHSNQICFSWSDENHSRSKAQMSLKKIIDFISSPRLSCDPSPSNEKLESPVVKVEIEETKEEISCERKQKAQIDLNLRLGPDRASEENQNTGFSACSGVGGGVSVKFSTSVIGNVSSTVVDKSSEGECDVANSSDDFVPTNQVNKDEERHVVEDEERRELSEITNLHVQTSEIEQVLGEKESEDAEKRKTGEDKNDGLCLLVEAARLVEEGEGDQKPKNKKKTRGKREVRNEAAKVKSPKKIRTESETEPNESIGCETKRNDKWMSEFYEDCEDISPVVRSKRGRSQVLPSRYRDSILEPWKPIFRARSSRVGSSSTKPRSGK